MVLLFWPFMIGAVILSFIALAQKRPWLLVISCFLILPISLYLAATPLFRWWGLIFPLLYLGAAWALRKNRIWIAGLFIIPILIVIGWLGFLVITQ